MMIDLSTRWVNLASEKLGAKAIACSDDFFAPMQRMLSDAEPVFIAGKYDDNGKWMDGWESRRKRQPGHDWCVVKLARSGIVHGIEIDTAHFTGNYAPAVSVAGCHCPDGEPGSATVWRELLDKSALEGDRLHRFEVADAAAQGVCNYLRLNLYPDGGVARFRVFAQPYVDWDSVGEDAPVDLAAALNGGVALYCNDQHFGHMRNLLTPGRGVNMGDGWETARRRRPGHDRVVIALAHRGEIDRVEIDTAHFKGNYPDRISLQGADLAGRAVDVATIDDLSNAWPELLPAQKMQADQIRTLRDEITPTGPITHVRMNLFPDGGVSRLRLYGRIVRRRSAG